MAKRLIYLFVITVIAISALILITCALPSNPVDDPTNFDMKVTAKDTSTIYTGKKAIIGLHINIPKHLESLKVNFGMEKKILPYYIPTSHLQQLISFIWNVFMILPVRRL